MRKLRIPNCGFGLPSLIELDIRNVKIAGVRNVRKAKCNVYVKYIGSKKAQFVTINSLEYDKKYSLKRTGCLLNWVL